MGNQIRHPWYDAIRSLFGWEGYVQVAALCWRRNDAGGVEVLMQTSLTTRRWIIPKGWPMDGKSLPETAAIEAWEEAGVIADHDDDAEPVGFYEYVKIKSNGRRGNVRLHVFDFEVRGMDDAYPERGEREQRWMPPAEAADLVQEPDLADLLRTFVPR